MFIANNWKDYEIIDTAHGRKLERWGKYILDRPDPQVIWSEKIHPETWNKSNGIYHRSKNGGGEWEIKSLPEDWQISYSFSDGKNLKFNLKPFSFKHTGLFPEQAANWDWMHKLIFESNRDISVLNLFAYTGGATLACASAGAKVTHVDASKGMVNWAKENAAASGLAEAPIRWLFDDCGKFIQREIRRGNKYDAIIMDPPSYGRGPKGEIWKMEEMIFDFVNTTKEVLSENPLFVLINSYTTGLASGTMEYVLRLTFSGDYPTLKVDSDEVGLPVDAKRGLYLPCGAAARATF